MKKKLNCILPFAKLNQRNYIVPEDITSALVGNSHIQVMKDFLQILAAQRVGIEDKSLCAYLAWKG